MAKIVLSVNRDETRMALLEQGELAEYVVERDSGAHLVGSIYKGRVSHVVRSLQAAFIDVGLEQNAFLYLGKSQLTEGETVLVQITKDAREMKGPSATRALALPGKFVVLLVSASYIGVSRQIKNEAERIRLSNICRELCPEHLGLIVRTAAEGAPVELLRKDVADLLEELRVLQAREKLVRAPALVHRELDLAVRIVRDYLSVDLDEIVVDNENTFGRIKELLATLPTKVPKLTLYEGEDVFASYGLQEAIRSVSQRQVELPGGGSLIFDSTEAMTVIDVNSGRFNSLDNLEDTTIEINRQAAIEIARQLRLRDIGGSIVVDFIDMHSDGAKLAILSTLQDALERDRMRPRVQDITVLNLVEITRKKSRQNLSTLLYTACPVCQGTGKLHSEDTLLLDIKRRIRRMLERSGGRRKVLLVVNPWLRDRLLPRDVQSWEREMNCRLKVEFRHDLHPEAFQVMSD